MDPEGAADLLGNNDSAQVVYTTNNASCFHMIFSLSSS